MIIPFPRFLSVSFILSVIALAPCGAWNNRIPAIYRYATSNPVSRRSLENNFQRSTIKNQIMLRASLSTVSIDKAKPTPLAFPRILWRFTRPHTLVGSALAIPAIHALAAPSIKSFFSVTNFSAIIFAMLPALLMNLYITGLNQITDVDIDKINKPDLPIAAGDLHINVAIFVVLIALVTSLWMGSVNPSQGLNVALWGSGILGTLYSLPPFRFKRFPLLAAFCISAVRGTIINAGFFSYAKHAAFGSKSSSVIHYLLNDRACMLSSAFFGIFGIVVRGLDICNLAKNSSH
jgi:homogentisate phytyltransferase / homogentisate geranylgeranyltransferase